MGVVLGGPIIAPRSRGVVAVVLSSSAWRRHIVLGGVLLGVGHAVVLLVEMSLVFLKLKEKRRNSQAGLGGDISWSRRWSPL